MSAILGLQVFSCCFMTGVIWMVQILVYPNFQFLKQRHLFAEFHRFHTERITWIIAPVMGIEFISGAYLCWKGHDALYLWNFGSILLGWGLTWFVSVPIHRRLEQDPSAESKRRLVLTHWPRTILWTSRSTFWFCFLQKQMF